MQFNGLKLKRIEKFSKLTFLKSKIPWIKKNKNLINDNICVWSFYIEFLLVFFQKVLKVNFYQCEVSSRNSKICIKTKLFSMWKKFSSFKLSDLGNSAIFTSFNRFRQSEKKIKWKLTLTILITFKCARLIVVAFINNFSTKWNIIISAVISRNITSVTHLTAGFLSACLQSLKMWISISVATFPSTDQNAEHNAERRNHHLHFNFLVLCLHSSDDNFYKTREGSWYETRNK